MSFEISTTAQYQNTVAIGAAHIRRVAESLNIANLFKFNISITTVTTIPNLISSLEELVGSSVVKMTPIHKDLILKFDDLVISLFIVGSDHFENTKKTVQVLVYGDMKRVEQVVKLIGDKYSNSKSNKIDWYYLSSGKAQSTTLDLQHKHEVHDEFFPWIKPDVATFQQNFLNSSANILLLIGEPGCGKTSFVRDMINRNNLSTAISYDEELMGKDSFFIEFMNKSYDLLVLEDADVILKDRESGNKVMNKLLNAGDGLIQTSKKIIFTANITHLDQVDPALIRPGRCFDALVFREMTYTETMAAAAAAGLPEPDGARTLSKLFESGHTADMTSRFGFDLSHR